MTLREPEYEALSPEAKAAWHSAEGGRILAESRQDAEHRAYYAEKHSRTARRILWAADLRKQASAAA